MTRDEVRCPSCGVAPGEGCELPNGKPYGPGHAARIKYAGVITTGPVIGDVLVTDGRKFRLRKDGAWRPSPNGTPLAFRSGARVDFDTGADVWRFKADGPLVLAEARP